jgi:carboxyl-terminal processing protease
MVGSYHGIGIEYDLMGDTAFLFRIFPGSPAEKAGLRVGDAIMQIDTHQLSGSGLNMAQTYDIWHSTGDRFTLTYLSLGKGMEKKVEIEKKPIQMISVPASIMLESNVGFVKIVRFSSDTYTEFMKAVESLVDQGAEHLVIDLRNNPGGSFDAVVKILNQLIEKKDQLMVYVEGKHIKKTEYKATGKVFFPFKEIKILINEHSVSASEVLAGVLQDLDRAEVIGRRSYGKALVQEMYELGDQAAINLTIGKYFMPSGRYIQKDFSNREEYESEIKKRVQSGELYYEDSIPISEAESLSKKKRTLAVGMGIVPDIFVPAIPYQYLPRWKSIEKSILKYSFKIYLERRDEIEMAIEKEDLNATVSHEAIKRFCEENTILFQPLESTDPDLVEFMDVYLKLMLVWLVEGEESFYEHLSKVDQDIKTAVKNIQTQSINAEKEPVNLRISDNEGSKKISYE